MQTHSRIETHDRLTEEVLLKLFYDEIAVLIVKNYYPIALAKKLGNKLIRSKNRAHYTHEIMQDNQIKQEYFGVDREGFPFNLLYDKDPEDPVTQQYYNEAPKNIARIRSYSAPALTPIDKLRLELDENYVYGAMIASFQSRKMLAGIGRTTVSALSHLSEEEPHFDALPEKVYPLDAQFACNIYLEVPAKGGELEVWDVPPMEPLGVAPQKWRTYLPQALLLKPEMGDLIIFNCRRPHAIRSFKGKPRVTMQTFLGYRKNQSLLIWN